MGSRVAWIGGLSNARSKWTNIRHVYTLGLLAGILVSIVHTEQADHIRVISMRKATRHEREIYIQNISY